MAENNRASNNLRKLNIDPESELGLSLLKLDSVYEDIENTERQINFLSDKKSQLMEDAEMMEMLLMHKFNKDTRMQKWVSEK
jgi:hypothetical protein